MLIDAERVERSSIESDLYEQAGCDDPPTEEEPALPNNYRLA
jgi:hypothetical protein